MPASAADVNGNNWVAYPTTDGEYVMIPGWETQR